MGWGYVSSPAEAASLVGWGYGSSPAAAAAAVVAGGAEGAAHPVQDRLAPAMLASLPTALPGEGQRASYVCFDGN